MSTTTPSEVSLVKPREIWNTMPGWGIVTNLMPPEILAARKLRVLRRLLVAVLIVIVLLVLAAYGLAWRQHRAAADELATAQDRTASLQRSQAKYQGAVKIQKGIDSIDQALAGMLSTDADTAAIVGAVRAQLPSGMSINQYSLMMNKAGSSGGNSAETLDTSGVTHIGTITLSGNAQSLTAVSQFVDNLNSIRGVVQPYPASNTEADKGVTWSIQLTLTSDLYTHAYDVKNGSK